MKVQVSINPLEVLVAHQKKSGTRRHQPDKPKGGTREATVIAPEVWRLVNQASAVAAQFEAGSTSATETMEQMFVVLIQQYGVEVCGDVLCSACVAWMRTDGEKLRQFASYAFGAFVKLRRFKETKPILSRMKLSPLQRMGFYYHMGAWAPEEDRAEILEVMRSYAETITEWSSYYDARYRIFLVSHEAGDLEFLNNNWFRRFPPGRSLEPYDLTLQFEIYMQQRTVEGVLHAVRILEQLELGSHRHDLEYGFQQCLTVWDRGLLLQLSRALEGSRYAAVVQRIALDKRDPNKDWESDEGTGSAQLT